MPAGKGDKESAWKYKGPGSHRARRGKDGEAADTECTESDRGGAGGGSSCLLKSALRSRSRSRESLYSSCPEVTVLRMQASETGVMVAPADEDEASRAPLTLCGPRAARSFVGAGGGPTCDAPKGECTEVLDEIAASLRGLLAGGIHDVSKLEQAARCVRSLREYLQQGKVCGGCGLLESSFSVFAQSLFQLCLCLSLLTPCFPRAVSSSRARVLDFGLGFRLSLAHLRD